MRKAQIEAKYGVRIERIAHKNKFIDRYGNEMETPMYEVFPLKDFHSFDGPHSLLCYDMADVNERVEAPKPCDATCDCRDEECK